jgi:serine/threonine protein kinase/tetratricopeptide (TPR) repeat protein
VDPRIVDLLLRYEESQAQGHPPTPEEVCRDCPELLDRFRQHLQGLHRANARLGLAAAGAAPASLPDLPGYEILGELGRGGMGVVYQARQVNLNRLVALKMVLAAEHASPHELTRFRAEAETLARLQHPNIVQIYEVGEHQGRPFFALEYMAGGSLAGRLAGRPAPVRPAAALVEVLARAVHAAHERGIIHRDLKPANILLGKSSVEGSASSTASLTPPAPQADPGAPWPLLDPEQPGAAKVSDFGLAKQAGGAGPTPSSGAVLGTPSYIAPEQAGGKSKEVGPAVDVYGLGAILYELLTGRPPFQAETALDVILQVVSQEPVTPSLLRPGLPRDLTVICLKCLEKQPRKRYPSARDLADDLRRFQESRPILARPVGRVERAWRWCRRQPLAAGLLAALLIVFVGGFAAVTWKWLEADRERSQAVAQRDRAERVLRAALDTNIAVEDLAGQLKPIAGTQSTTVKNILQLAARNYERLLREGGETPPLLEGKARMLTAFSELYIDLGDTGQALALAKEARAIYTRLLEREPDNARWRAGLATGLERVGVALRLQRRLAGCRAAFDQSLTLRKRLVAQFPGNPEYLMDLSASHVLIGQFLIDQRCDVPKARQAYRRAFVIRKKLAASNPANRKWQAALASSYEKVGHGLFAQYQYPRALKAYRSARGIYSRLAAREPTNAQWQMAVARNTRWMGMTHQNLGQPDRAKASFTQALGISERLARLNPSNMDWQEQVMGCRWSLADLRKKDSPVEAFREQLATVRDLEALAVKRARKDRHNASWQHEVSRVKWMRGLDLAGLAKHGISPAANYARAAKVLKEALQIDNALYRKEPSDFRCVLNLASTYHTFGKVLEAQGQNGAALAAGKKAIQILLNYFQDRVAEEPRNPAWLNNLAENHILLATWYSLQSEHGKELAQHRAALRCYQRLRKLEPDNNHWLYHLAMTYSWVSQALGQKARLEAFGGNNRLPAGGTSKDGGKVQARLEKSRAYAKSLTELSHSVRLLEQLVRREPGNPRWQRELAEGYYSLANAHGSRNNFREQETAFAGYLNTLEKALALDPKAARRNPLDPEKTLSTAGMAIRQLSSSPVDPRRQVLFSERHLYFVETLRKDQNLIESYSHLVRSLDLSRPKDALEARWALRRGLGFLRQRQAQKRLHRIQQRLIPFFEATLKKVPGQVPERNLAGPALKALEELDYRKLAELLLREGRPRELVRLLAREAREASQVPWVKKMVRIVAARSLLPRPELLDPVLETAGRIVKEDPKQFPAEGRALLAFLARYGGQPNTAVLLDSGEARAPVNQDVSLFLSERRRLAGLPDELRTPWQIAEFYNLFRKFSQASDQWRKLLHDRRLTSPAYRTNARNYLASAYGEQGKWNKAEAQLKKILAKHPKNTSAQHVLAQVYAEQNKNLRQAEALIRKALQADPKSPYYRSDLGWILALRGNGAKGLKMMEEVATSPALAQNLFFFDRLGDIYRRQGQPEKARQAWRKALSLFPNSTPRNDRRQTAIRRKLVSLVSKTSSGTNRKPIKR